MPSSEDFVSFVVALEVDFLFSALFGEVLFVDDCFLLVSACFADLFVADCFGFAEVLATFFDPFAFAEVSLTGAGFSSTVPVNMLASERSGKYQRFPKAFEMHASDVKHQKRIEIVGVTKQ